MAAFPQLSPTSSNESASPSPTSSKEILAGTQLHSLVLDGSSIYSTLPSAARTLYQLTYPAIPADVAPSQTSFLSGSPPSPYDDALAKHSASSASNGVHKVRYYLDTNSNGDGTVTSRLSHIYTFSDSRHAPLAPRRRSSSSSSAASISSRRRNSDSSVVITGHRSHRSSARTYASVAATPTPSPSSRWDQCLLEGHFRADHMFLSRSAGSRRATRRDDQLVWKEAKTGRVVAVETIASMDAGGLPQLDLKTLLSERELDLLVTGWVVRVWKQASRELEMQIPPVDSAMMSSSTQHLSPWVQTAVNAGF